MKDLGITKGEWWNESGVIHCDTEHGNGPHIAAVRGDDEDQNYANAEIDG